MREVFLDSAIPKAKVATTRLREEVGSRMEYPLNLVRDDA
jgi:hypothetical protein